MAEIDKITIIVIAANVLFSLKGFKDYGFLDKYKFHVGGVQRGEKIRVLTAGFLHIDMQHLLFNMITLYFFAGIVINYLGASGFIIVYLGSLIFGNLLSLYFHKNEYHYSAVGASGAVTGILYSAILLQPGMTLGLYFIVPIPAYIFGIGYLLYSIYGMKKRIGNIGHDAHFGGAIGGYIITLFMAPWIFERNLLMVGLLAIPIILLFVLRRAGKI
ncbi:rhomboid family intramembrane serine protease [Seonamhaeicola maritimus]|uniref:Rhomboid family intramembrane serine protease n=1 Tax=Seonamhaeicola maritimus TaxID=2591822 RepID=A0A5C7GFH5_9FLAO|nr:rhomboid family intramembrane serine protease [Seonamhaeicola maritimus]TXG35438.1 rhomboid family intramembrane serine protease [Seonamhaeicola maritimus]